MASDKGQRIAGAPLGPSWAGTSSAARSARVPSIATHLPRGRARLLEKRPAPFTRGEAPGRPRRHGCERIHLPADQHVIVVLAVELVAEGGRVPLPAGGSRGRRH